MPIHHRRFAFALVSLMGFAGAARAQPPWDQQRHEEMREHEERREDRIRHEEREAEFAREREWRHRHEEERRAEEREQFRHEDRGPERPDFNR